MASIFQFFPNSRPDSVNRKIFRAALTVGLVSVLAKAGLAFRDLVIAQAFGRSDIVDAFLIALLLPSFVLNLLMGALGSALIPVLVEVRRKQGEEAAQELLSSMMCLSLVALLGIVVLLGIFAPYYVPFLGSNFPDEKLHLTRELLYLLLPSIVFSGLVTFTSSVLNAGEKFALPALVPLVTPMVTIAVIYIGAKRWGAFALAGGTVVGSLCEAVLLLTVLKAHGIRLRLKWYGLDARVRTVLGQYAPMVAAAFLMGSTLVVDQAMAAMLPGGSVAALNYAKKMVAAVVAIGATALSTAALPYFSRMAAEDDWHGCRHTLKRYSLLVISTALPFTLLLITLSRPLIRIFFQRGAFTSADTDLVSWVQTCYAIQIPFYMLGMLFVRFLTSIKRNDVLMYISVVNLAADVTLNLILMKKWGVAGIALSTSFVYIISCSLLVISSIRLLNDDRFAISPAKVQRATQ